MGWPRLFIHSPLTPHFGRTVEPAADDGSPCRRLPAVPGYLVTGDGVNGPVGDIALADDSDHDGVDEDHGVHPLQRAVGSLDHAQLQLGGSPTSACIRR